MQGAWSVTIIVCLSLLTELIDFFTYLAVVAASLGTWVDPGGGGELGDAPLDDCSCSCW